MWPDARTWSLLMFVRRLADVNMCSKWSEYGRILQEKGLVTQFAFYSKGGHLWTTTSSHFQVEPEEFTYLTAGFQVQSNEGLSF